VSLTFPGNHLLHRFEWLNLKEWVRGLACLVLLFDIYTVYQQLQLQRVRRELSQRNQLFEVITENAADMIAVVDCAGNRLYSSPSYQKVLGYSPEELKLTSSLEQVHPEDQQRVVEAADRARITGKGERLEYRIRHKDALAALNLPPQLAEIADLQNGIVLVTGPTGSGKSSTLAAVLDRINESHAYHILTIEDPIEFMHRHKRSIVHQRELHSDTPSFALALRAALRQAPKVILVGEMRDKETIEIALEAAETGHLVLSTLHTIDASKTVERVIGAFPMGEQHTIRNRLAKSFRAIISQRLIPRKDGSGRVAIVEILKSTLRTREYVEKGEQDGRTLLEAMIDGDTDGMQHFDGEIERLVRDGLIDVTTGLAYATNPGNLRLVLTDMGSAATEERPVQLLDVSAPA